MTFFDSVSSVFDKYATGSGRASRSEYWWWTLFVFIASFGAGILDGLVGMDSVNIFSGILSLALFVPNLCVAIRRCHDSGHSGWWAICPIVNLIMMFLPSDSGINEYGAPEGQEETE